MKPELLQSILNELSKTYPNNNYFSLSKAQNLSQVCNAPQEPGVYCILKIMKDKKELVYIGASGTMNQNGNFGNQLLCNRLLKGKQDGIGRRRFFESQFLMDDVDRFEIHWFVTHDEYSNHLPKYIEGCLLQKFFELNGCLPIWNKSF